MVGSPAAWRLGGLGVTVSSLLGGAWCALGLLLGCSWVVLVFLGGLGVLLGCSWGALGVFRRSLGMVLSPLPPTGGLGMTSRDCRSTHLFFLRIRPKARPHAGTQATSDELKHG